MGINITVEPQCSLIDERVSIIVRGLKPKVKVKIKAFSPDYYKLGKKRGTHGEMQKSIKWSSWGIFESDSNGLIDLSKQKPIQGTYHTADSMGFFWSMNPQEIVRYNLSKNLGEIPVMRNMKVVFTVEKDGQGIASCECKRIFSLDSMDIENITDDGLVARFFNSPSQKSNPGVLVIGGSDGSIYNSQKLAEVLACHGYAALALAYYGMEGLPDSLENIPIEYVEKAVQWMKKNNKIDCSHLCIFGKSKGGELALLAGSYINDIHAVIALVPSPISFEGLNVSGRTGGKGSWTCKNKTIPFINLHVNTATFGMMCFLKILQRKPIPLHKLYGKAIRSKEKLKDCFFPIEKINGPVLLISSSNDYVWPSKKLCELAEERFKAHQFHYKHSHYCYHSGHFIFLPYEPTAKSDLSLEDNAYADQDSWSKILLFLKKNCCACPQ